MGVARLLAVAAFGVFLAGCGAYSIPRIAVEGGTITIPVPNSYGPGFGRVLSDAMPTSGLVTTLLPWPAYNPASGLEDELRGELVFALHDMNFDFITYLPVRYLTRVHMDEGSKAGNPNTGAGYAAGQVLAFVDIPVGVRAKNGSDQFYIYVSRFIRNGSSAPYNFLATTPVVGGYYWISWGHPFWAWPVGIKILANSTESFNPFTGWGLSFGDYQSFDVTGDLPELIPQPKLPVTVIGGPTPAAWEVEVTYPADKVEVIGAELSTNQKSTAVLALEHIDSGKVKVSVVDPRQLTNQVKLVLVPEDLTMSSGTASPGDFQEVAASLRAYDENGVDISAPWDLFINAKFE